MGQSNEKLSDALQRLSSAKYGLPRAKVEQEIFKRLAVKKEEPTRLGPNPSMSRPGGAQMGAPGKSSFLDEWLAKRKQMASSTAPKTPLPAQPIAPAGVPSQPSTLGGPASTLQEPVGDNAAPGNNGQTDSLNLHGPDNSDNEVTVKFR